MKFVPPQKVVRTPKALSGKTRRPVVLLRRERAMSVELLLLLCISSLPLWLQSPVIERYEDSGNQPESCSRPGKLQDRYLL